MTSHHCRRQSLRHVDMYWPSDNRTPLYRSPLGTSRNLCIALPNITLDCEKGDSSKCLSWRFYVFVVTTHAISSPHFPLERGTINFLALQAAASSSHWLAYVWPSFPQTGSDSNGHEDFFGHLQRAIPSSSTSHLAYFWQFLLWHGAGTNQENKTINWIWIHGQQILSIKY